MLSLLIICFLAGSLGAILQGMLGIGTGIIIVPVLTFILPYYHFHPEQTIHIAIATSMAAITINSVTALMNHYRYQTIDWKMFRHLVVFCTTGSGIGALLATFLNGHFLKIIFSIFLISLASWLLFKKNAHETSESMPSIEELTINIKWNGLRIGCLASLVGSAGGILMVPFLRKLQYPMRYAVGTSTLIGLPIALTGSLIYIVLGMVKIPVSPFTIGYIHWPALLAITTAGLFGAPLGVKLSTRVPAVVLQRLFALIMLAISLNMLRIK
ncbi:sulfite exporter TauE/SafE family protein [Legionella micdadei]|uniref:Probable membrane transporter protein n=1 Tax=Legionella micdadei TaxID=451 RepID=A0A098GIB7_LEGMI|nr:sulfite exporter TauE/SafE family protein [Legionella micdadei]ARG96872.1 anion permease [Legionella micdadei]ARG99606.1 anion permease [Legionella micdadei]KTD26554.1 transmembrane protein [Legionella micdadei]NSL17855.1 sulfite exporter TauE/SafE family protein [Legionella micdadei]CEG61727.1 conserved membrane protein of unknown function [Legionella micdadei]